METNIDELYKSLFKYIKKRVNQTEDAEDLTQEVFLKLAKSDLEKVNNVKHWVYAIAKNTLIDYYRKNRMYSENTSATIIEETLDENTAVRELSKCVASFIKQLPSDYKEIMELSELNEVAQKEIAKQLNMNYVTVRSKIQRGRKKLKAIFTACCTISQNASGNIVHYKQHKNCSTTKETVKSNC